jgi:hypothetical protein
MKHILVEATPDPKFPRYLAQFTLCGATPDPHEVEMLLTAMGHEAKVNARCPSCELRVAVLLANNIPLEGTQAEVIARIDGFLERA